MTNPTSIMNVGSIYNDYIFQCVFVSIVLKLEYV